MIFFIFTQILERKGESEKLCVNQEMNEQQKPNFGFGYSECRIVRRTLLI